MIYQLKRTQTNRRPQAFWGSLIPSALSFVGGLITSSQQAKAQRRALEEQQRLAKQQLDISNQNQLATTLNNYAIAQQSYDDKDYNLKYRIGGVKRLGGRNIMITDGGNAKRIGNNTYLLRGGSHEDINETGQTGIGINVGGNEIEAEGGEVAQRKGNSLRIYSAQPILGGISPAEAIMKGYNKDRVFNAQQRFKKNNGIKDDGSKAKYGTTIPYKRIHINEDGTFTDILTGKNYTTSATNGEDIVITGKKNHWKEAGKKNTSRYFDPMGAIHFASAAGAPILNATPSNIFGSIREAKDFNSFINNYMNYDSGGFFNKEYAEKHPYISFIGNVIADGAIGGLANKGIDGYRLAKSFYKSEKPYINTIANSRLYSDNPIINTYATYARRYNLPDKARVPYMIRRVESDELPTINNGRITMSGDRFKHTNFTYDRPVVSHRKGKWDSAQQTYLINGRRLVSENKGNWGSIEPSDMFTIQDPKGGLTVPTKDVILVSGHKGLLGQAKASGIKIATSPQLQRIEKSITTKQSLGRFNLAGERRHYNTPYWIDVNNIVKEYGTPKLKDVRLLEEMTGLKSGVSKLDNKAIKIINDANRFNKLKVSEAEEVMNQVYPNGRGVNFTNDREVYITGQFPYNNLFYDPTTYAESNYVFPKRLGGHCKFKFGGLTSKDRGSSKHPYPSVSSKDFAGGNRSYPIPTKADAIDALRLAGLHGRSDVRSKVYNKYPELRKKARGGTKVDPYYDWAINTSSNLGISFIDPTYDYRAYYNSVTPYERNLIRFAPQGTHFTDIGKTPKHPTFSNESIYSNKKHSGGTWNGNVFVPNIWQFGNNGNKVRNKYMNNSGEGYFNGRVNIFPKYRKKAEIGTLVPGGIPGTDSYRARMHSGYNISPFDLLNILNYLDRAVGFVDENGNTRYITGIAPAPGIPNKAQIIRNIQQANKVAQATRASQAAQRTSYAVKQAKDFYRDLGINIPVGRSQTYNPAFRSSALARNIEDSNKALQMSLNTHLPKGIRLTSADQSSIGRTAARVINPREAELVKQGINISQSARNMTSGSNPFLYAERTPSQIKAGLNRAFGVTKQGVKNAGQKVKDFRNKVTNSNTYRSKTGFEERYNPTLGAYEQYNTYKLKPWVKATAGAAGTAGVIGLGVGLSNTKSEDKSIKAQLDAKGKPISPYIARPQEPAKSQTKTVKPTRQVNKVVKRQVRTTPQYTGNTTKGNYQLHDGETKVINGVKYTRRGNTIINHKTNVGYIYDKNGNYTGQADYSKVGNFNQAFDLARAAGRNQFIYHAGKYNNYSTVKETNAKKEALNRRIGARRIAKRMGGLTNPPVERFKCGGHIRPKAEDGMLAPIYSYGTNRRRLPSFAPIDITPRAIPNFKPVSVSTNTKTPFDPNSVPFLGNQSTFKPATQDYIGLGIDTLAALGSGMFTRSAYNKMNFDYALPNYVDESPVAFDTTYHNEAQRANIERNRLNARNLIRGNTASAQTSLGRMQQSDVDAMMETNKLLDEKSNKEVELRNQNAANEQQVRARNAAARNQYYQNVAQIKNAAIEAKNNMELAKAQSIGVDLSGLSQAWTNFAGSVEQRYDNRQKEAIIAATSKDPAVLSNAVQFGYNFSPEVLAAIYNSTDDDNLKSLALSQLSTKNRLRYGIR